MVPGSSTTSVGDDGSDRTVSAEFDGQCKQQDDDNKFWRSSIMQPPTSGNNSQSSSDGISQVSAREQANP